MSVSRRVSCEEAYTSPVWVTPDTPASSSTPPPDLGVPPTITSGAPPGGSLGYPYSFTVTATGDAPIFFAASGLPPGLSLDPVTGVLSSTPTTLGSFSGSFTASNGVMPDDTQLWTIEVKEAPVITSPIPPGGDEGSPYSYTVTATGSPTIVFSATGLPGGLTIDGGSGVISGTPSASGDFNTVIRADNGVNPADEQVFVFTIGAPHILAEDGSTITVGTQGTLDRDGSPSAKISELGDLTGEPTPDDLFVASRPSDGEVASATLLQLYGSVGTFVQRQPGLLDDSLVIPSGSAVARRASPVSPGEVAFGESGVGDMDEFPGQAFSWHFSPDISSRAATLLEPYMRGTSYTNTGYPASLSTPAKVFSVYRNWDFAFRGMMDFRFGRFFFGVFDAPCTAFSASDAPAYSYMGVQFSSTRGDTVPRMVIGISGVQTFFDLLDPDVLLQQCMRTFALQFRTADNRLRFYVENRLVGITDVGASLPTSYSMRPAVQIRHLTGSVPSYLYFAKVDAKIDLPSAYLQ